jgi:long-subunit fatty acid transport protein
MMDWMGSTPMLEVGAKIFELPTSSVPYEKGTVVMKGADVPPRVQMGVMLRPFKPLRLMCDIHWMQYSSFNKITMMFDQDMQPLQLAKFMGHTEGARQISVATNFNDEFHFSYGIEYQALEWLALRLGYEDRQASTTQEYFSLFFPFPDMHFWGWGCGINLKNGMDIDVGFGYIYCDTWHIKDDTSRMMNAHDFTEFFAVYRGLDVEGEFEAFFGGINLTTPIPVVEDILNHQAERLGRLIDRLNPFD